MGLRQTLNEKRGLSIAIIAGAIVLALLFIIWQSSDNTSDVIPQPEKAYYSDDDGVTYFADDISLVPPFDHNGKKAYLANVVMCQGKPHVRYLQRFTPAIKKKLDEERNKNTGVKKAPVTFAQEGVQVKAPKTGDTGWVDASLDKSSAIMQAKCPDGGEPEPMPPPD